MGSSHSSQRPSVREGSPIKEVPDDYFSSVESVSRTLNALCEEYAACTTNTILTLGGRTLPLDATATPPSTGAEWQKVGMAPTRKHVRRRATVHAHMAPIAMDWGIVDHLVLGGRLAKLEPPRPDYIPGEVFMEPCAASAAVFCFSGSNKKVAEGTIRLGSGVVVVLDAACRDVHLRDLTFQGGLVVCHGEGCSVTFTNVAFQNTCLVVLAGARCLLDNVKFFNATQQLLCLAVKGASTCVSMRGGSVLGGENGVLVEGARFDATDVAFESIVSKGVTVEGKLAHAAMTRCTLSKFMSLMKLLPNSEDSTYGIHVRRGGAATLNSVSVNAADIGVSAHTGSLTMTDCTVTQCFERGLQLKSGAKLTATASTFSQTGPGPPGGVFSGVTVADKGSHALLDGCTLDDNHESAVTVVAAAAHVRNCSASGNQGVDTRALSKHSHERRAAFATIGGRMTIENTNVTGSTAACGGSGKFSLKGVTLNGAAVLSPSKK